MATIGLVTLIGIVAMLAATRFGIGVSPDSTVYLEAARNLAHGNGLVALTGASNELKPLTHYPPLYSALLAFFASAGVSVESAARWLNSAGCISHVSGTGSARRAFIRAYKPSGFRGATHRQFSGSLR